MKMLKKIAREDNFLSLTGNLVIAILGISGFALLARSLSLDVFGEWVLFVTGGSFVEMFRFESFHMYGIIGSAVITGVVLLQLSKRFKMNTTEGNPIALPEKAKQYKKALFGGSIFGQVILFYHFVEVFLQGTADNDKPRGQVSHSKTSSSNEDLFLYPGCR